MTLRILFVVSGSVESASQRYRAGHLKEALLQGSGAQVSVVSAEASAPVRVCQGDIVVLHRLGFSGAGERFLKAARRVGAALVWSADDLIFTSDFAHQIGMHFPDDPVRYHQHRAAVEDFRAMLCACDAALVSTGYLAEQVRSALTKAKVGAGETPPVFVIRNFLSEAHLAQAKAAVCGASPLPPSALEAPPVTIAYLSGSATHDIDLGTIAAPLASTLSRFPQARLLLVGPVTLPPALRPFAEAGQILRHCLVPWSDLPGLLTYCRVDINLAPLDTARPFLHAKSEVKFLEAAAVGIPTIASSTAGFTEGVRDGTDCLLAASPADWENHLAALIQKPELRQRLGEAAASALRARGTVVANAEIVHSVFAHLARLTPERSGSSEVGNTKETHCWVRLPLRERVLQAAKSAERHLMRRSLRLSRHLQRLREDMSGG